MMITPSAKGSFLAGITVSLLGWSIVLHTEKLPIIGRFLRRDNVVTYVSENRTFTTLLTETMNLFVHGITNPLSALFAGGSTVVNLVFIWLVCPFLATRVKPKTNKNVVSGKVFRMKKAA